MASTPFSQLDSVTGGLPDGSQTLLCGVTGSGKTTFGLGFLSAGLEAGHAGLLITDRPLRQILQQARTFGFELEEGVRDGRLVVFEYPENVTENLESLIDDSRVARELQAMIGERMIQRVVFDPLTPLLAGSHRESSAERIKALVRSMAEQGATTLFAIDLPEGVQYLPACRESVGSVLRFESGSGGRSVRLEGFPGHEGTEIAFDLVPGKGFVHAADESEMLDPAAATPGPRTAVRFLPPLPKTENSGTRHWTSKVPRILVLEPDGSRRQWLRSVFAGEHRVIEAQNAADGLALVASESPDAIVLNEDLKGVTGREVARRLRSSGRTQPVVILGDKLFRTADRVEAMLAGADACFPLPVDSRLLRLSVSNLLSWQAGWRAWRAVDAKAFRSPQRDPVSYTSDPEYFARRSDYEAGWGGAMAVPFCIVSMRPPASASVEDLASTVAILTRSSDLTFAGPRGILVLLAEAPSEEGFLGRFRCRWTGGYKPTVEVLRFEQQPDFSALVRSLIAGVAEPGGGLLWSGMAAARGASL